MRKTTLLKTLLVAVSMLLGGANCALGADTAYWTEDFEDALGSGWSLSVASLVSATQDKKLGSKDLRMPKKNDENLNGSYVTTPTFDGGVSSITFWQCRNSNRTLTIYTSIDGGTNWTKHSDVSANSSAIATVTINNPFVNRIKIANESGSDVDLDDLTVYHKTVVWKENYESTTLEAQQSAWTINDGSWPTAESVGTYAPVMEFADNQYGNSTKWPYFYGPDMKRQRTAYYMFASAYTTSTAKAYQFDAKLNMNIGNNGGESRFYIMNGAKQRNNEDPSNNLFYIGVNSSGYVYVSNGTDNETSTIGNVTTENVSGKWTKTYKSTGWFNVSCIIDLEQGKATVKITRGVTEETKTISLKSGTKQISGFGLRTGGNLYGVVALDDLALYELTYPAFTLSDDSKIVPAGGSRTISVTDITGTITGVSSSNTAIATALYDAGTITISGVTKGSTTITVTGTNDGITLQKTIDVEVRTYSELYEGAKEEYSTKIDALDAAGQAYWESNTSSSGVTDEASYNAAVDALPSTYIAAVKAQTTAGSDMTDVLKTEVSASSWTGATGTYGGVAAERYNGDTPYSTGKILYQTVDGLHAGYYKVKFYGVANVARTLTEEYYGSGIAQMYANSETQDIDVIYQDACTPISGTYLREFEVYLAEDNSSIEFGIQNIKEGGQWYVAQALSLTYIGTEKNDYTINAVAGGTTIKELATGNVWASESYGTYVPYVIEKDSKFYVLDDNSTYYKGFTMGATDETKEVSYTLDESIVGYTEGVGSGYRNVVGSNNPAYSGGDYINNTAGNGLNKRNRGFDLGTLPAGIYQMVAYVVNSANKRSVALRNVESEATASEPIIQITNNDKITGELKKNFRLEESTTLRVNGANSGTEKNNQMEEIDYVLIRKLNVNDDYVIVGTIDNATAYLTDMTDKVTLKPGESYRYQFVNHNSNGSDNTKNWVLPVYDSNDTKTIVVRADNWEDVAGANSGCTNNFNWTNFISKMDGATVDMTVSFTTDKKFTMSADIVTSTNDNWTYSYTSDYTGTAIDFSDDDYIKVALSVSLSWLEVLSEEQTAVSAKIGSAGWTTFASPYALNLSSMTASTGDVTAYYASSIGASSVKMTSTEKSDVIAGEGIMLNGTPGAFVSIPVVAIGTAIDGNKLVGCTTETVLSTNANYYVLVNNNGTPEFQNLSVQGATIPAGKAYLNATGVGAARLSIVFDDEATGISDVRSKMEDVRGFYDLQGRRVAQPTKGLYIVNGKKVIKK